MLLKLVTDCQCSLSFQIFPQCQKMIDSGEENDTADTNEKEKHLQNERFLGLQCFT
jgi:hypothetical protein